MAKKKRKWTRNQKESAVLITLGVSVLICGACFLSPLKDAVKFGSKAIVKDLPIDDIKTAYQAYDENKDELHKEIREEYAKEEAGDQSSEIPSGSDELSLEQATVIRVIDGDTYELEISGEKQKVRLIGVDTPESVAPSDYRTENTEEGKEVSQIVKEKFQDIDTVYVEYDVSPTDKYGRTLAYVYFEDGNAESLLLTAGHIASALLDPGIISIQHPVYEFIRTGKRAHLTALFLRGILLAPSQVVEYRA